MGNENAKCHFEMNVPSLFYLSTAELQENVNVFLVFKVMREFDDVLVRQSFVQLDLVCDL